MKKECQKISKIVLKEISVLFHQNYQRNALLELSIIYLIKINYQIVSLVYQANIVL
jgi:hypothetical protein